MTTNERPGKGAKAPVKRTNAKQRQAKNKRKLIIFGVEVFIILIMVAVLYLFMDRTEGEMHVTVIDTENVAINETVAAQTEEGGTMYGYMNIALFGVDAKTEKELYKSSRSDSIMVANINLETGEIKLVSVFRDSYLNRGDDTYNKCNGAYSLGGAEQAVRMLNMNLDLDITDFVTVGYAGLAEVIDGLGGVWIDVDEQEMKYINAYQVSIIGKQGQKYWQQWGGVWDSENLNFTPDEYFSDYDVKQVKESGYQLLDGLQATAYCRIRYVGNDFQRTERQREVIKAIESQAKQANLDTLTKVFNSAADDIYTSLDVNTILELLPHIADYKIVGEETFPNIKMRETIIMGAKGSCEVPVDLEESVKELHQFLYDDDNYQVSDTVKEIAELIGVDASKYR